MQVAVFSTKPYDRTFFQAANVSRMLTFPNVIITGHQAFFTQRALEAIAQENLANITAFEKGELPPGRITATMVKK